jgi:hypothetical protein
MQLTDEQKQRVRLTISREALACMYQIRVFCDEREYRRKRRCVIGYTYVKIGSHHMSGNVHEKIVVYADTFELAISKLEER